MVRCLLTMPQPTLKTRIAPSPGLMDAAGGLPAETISVADLLGRLRVRDEPGAGPVRSYRRGTADAPALRRRFIRSRLTRYDSDRNNPDRGGTSELSAYLQFGQIGPHTAALAVREADAPAGARDAFLEELIVRRELAVNFVARNPRCDRLAGCPRWARATLHERKGDPRAPRYTMDRLERARAANPIWNAAQIEMVVTGRMHGYMRMYWAKKILEWTGDPEEAFERAVTLNDRYELREAGAGAASAALGRRR
ncbi:MAG TPA: hypothetical protein VFP98_03005 [Candidatus Polarisedimenticolia bacterium]|nr:hypothetical protein [Candidatus Polarisedimenticolia bacterium]